MRGSVRWGLILLLAAVTVGFFAADNSGALAGVKASNRTDTWEFTLPIRYLSSQTLDFEHGTSIDLHGDLGWGFGFGYNFSEKMNLDFEFAWMSSNYTVKFGPGQGNPGPAAEATGSLDASSTTINFTYNFMPKTITPYVSGGIGWNWVDTNIPTGPPQGFCWWDPWYGQVCTTYQDTAYKSGFAYGLGLGVRFEPKETFFIRLGLNDMWQDFGSYSNTPDFLSYRFDLGWKF